MMMREQQWDWSNCRHFRIDVCLHQRIYMRAFVNARIYVNVSVYILCGNSTSTSTINFINLRPIHDIRDTVNVQTYIQKGMIHSANWLKM